MSQITRCPSCATTFKVVADQLRISEGWVRCGQCKEVFDASAHLLPVAPEALLPDVSLTDLRAPTAPVARKPDALGAWGGGKSTGAAPPTAANAVKATTPVTGNVSDSATRAAVTNTVDAPLFGAVHDVPAAPVLDIPSPAVPSFLTAGAREETSPEVLGDDLVAPFAWRAHSSPRAPAAVDAGATLSTPVPAEIREPVVEPTTAPRAGDSALDANGSVHGHGDAAAVPSGLVTPVVSEEASSLVGGALPPVTVPPSPAGYELPFAELRDSEVTLDASLDADAAGLVDLSGDPIHSTGASEALAPQPSDPSAALLDELRKPAPAPVAESVALAPPLPSVDFVPTADAPETPAMELVKDDSHAAILRARPRRAADDDDDAEDQESDPEVSFVLAARRKAFWRKPVVRMALGLVFFISLLGLALQIAVQERDRIAALDARTRPWLVKLCEPLRCELAPVRQIADVVIDSSSFNKARGDSYQLALTMKSTATIPLAMPAVELTLTDAQDQPVLRRVLLPTDMAAPTELPAKGEWGTSVSVLVTTGGARVAGYRLLAFYP